MAEAQVREPLTLARPQLAARSGLRVRPQRPARALAGALLVVASMVASLTVYSRIGDRHEVLALARTVLAGDRLADGDFKVVSISSDDSLTTVPASARPSLVGQYAKVRMLAGSLVVGDSVQPGPLVDPTKVLMSPQGHRPLATQPRAWRLLPRRRRRQRRLRGAAVTSTTRTARRLPPPGAGPWLLAGPAPA